MYETKKEFVADGNEGVTPIIDVTSNPLYEIKKIEGASGKLLAYPVIDINPISAGVKISTRRSERTGINQTINSNQVFNLLNLIRLQDLVFNDDNLTYTFDGTGINQVVKFPYVADRVSINLKVRITGEVGGSSGTLRSWVIEVRRPNDVVIDSRVTHKISTSNMNRESTDITSYMRGANDPFIIDGVKLMFNNTTGREVQINSIQFTTELIY